MAAEYIFLDTDPTFNLPLFVIRELRDAGRMQPQSQCSARIENIESNVDGDDNKLRFGRGGNDTTEFTRTAGAVIRMCMLRATNIPRCHWPNQNAIMKKRNRDKMQYEGNGFTLANELQPAKHYWSKYDQLYPHYIIQDKIDAAEAADDRQPVQLNSMMLIFRNNFQQIIEITTTANATRQNNHFDSYVNVLVNVYTIRQGEDADVYGCSNTL